jgi:hypothetical protein
VPTEGGGNVPDTFKAAGTSIASTRDEDGFSNSWLVATPENNNPTMARRTLVRQLLKLETERMIILLLKINYSITFDPASMMQTHFGFLCR